MVAAGRVAIATSTFYKSSNEIRARLALRTAEEAYKNGYPLVVVDGGSPAEFTNALLERGSVVLPQGTTGMGPGRRQALNEATAIARKQEPKTWAVVWMEPEKWPFVADIAATATPILNGEADLVVPARHQEGWASYPPEQVHSEKVGNLAFGYLTGRYLDVFFGPKVMNARALEFFMRPGKYGDLWDWLNITPMQIIAASLRVVGVAAKNYRHPAEQTQEETGNMLFLKKRIEQLMNQVPAFETEAKALGFIK